MNEEIKNYIDDKFRMQRRVELREVFGVYETVSTAPTLVPNTPFDQIKIYVNGATLRLYAYDTTAGVWHYITFSA